MELKDIYDIYVIKPGGVPLFAGCTGSEYCRNHAANHELVSGFLYAIKSFSEESFETSVLQGIAFNDFEMKIHSNNDKDLMFVFSHAKHANPLVIQKKIERAESVFMKTYAKEINKLAIDQNVFLNFRELLQAEDIVETITDSSFAQVITPDCCTRKPHLFQWLSKMGKITA